MARTTAPKTAARKTVVIDHVEPIRQEAETVHAADVSEPSWSDIWSACWQAFGGGMSVKRFLCASILSLAAAFGAGVLIGKLTGILMTAMFLATGSVFLAYVVMAVGLIVSFFAGRLITRKVFGYVADRKIDAHYVEAKTQALSAKQRVMGWFNTSVPAAA